MISVAAILTGISILQKVVPEIPGVIETISQLGKLIISDEDLELETFGDTAERLAATGKISVEDLKKHQQVLADLGI